MMRRFLAILPLLPLVLLFCSCGGKQDFDMSSPYDEGSVDPRTIYIDIDPASIETNVVEVAGSSITLAELEGILRSASKRYGTDTPIILRASEQLEHGRLMAVMETVSAAGLQEIKIAAIKSEK